MSVIIRDATGKEIKVAGLGGGGSANAVTVPGGAAITMGEGLGEGPYEFAFTAEEDAPDLTASDVGYSNTGSGLAATTVQGAVDEVAASVEAVKAAQAAGEVYSTEEVRIGTWVDGKPLYRRCWKVSLNMTVPYNQYVQIDPDFLGIEPIRFGGNIAMLWPGATYKIFYPLPIAEIKQNYEDSWSLMAYYAPNNGLMIHYSFGKWPSESNVYFGEFTIVVEYTKTTDEAEVSGDVN